jgi:AcrR family transcriptional regulator
VPALEACDMHLTQTLHYVQDSRVTETPEPTPAVGLRERRRQQTLREVAAATVELAREHGYERVTVDDISARAGISRRTFFNYFATKEDALLYPPLELPDDAVATFVADTSVPVGDGLVELLVAHTRHFEEHRGVFEALLAVVEAEPHLDAVLRRRFLAFEEVVAAAVAQRLGVPADDMLPQSLAAVSCTMLRLAARRSHHDAAAHPGEPDARRAAASAMEAELRRGFRTLETLVTRPT